MRETLKATGYGIYWVLVVFVVLVALTAGGLWVKPYFVRQETAIFRQSNSYVTAKQSALRAFKADYDAIQVKLAQHPDPDLVTALHGQQAGIVRQMRQEADTIPDDVPDDLRAFLARS